MKISTRRAFLRKYIMAGSAAMLASRLGGAPSLFATRERVKITVGFLPITDHLILPVAQSLNGRGYRDIQIRPYLCRSWDEIVLKMDMGVLQAAFLLCPLALHTYLQKKDMRCILLGHKNGSIIAAIPSITTPQQLIEKTIGIPHRLSTHRVLLYRYLQRNNISNLQEIVFQDVPPPLVVKSIQADRIQGYSVAEPWGLRGVSAGAAKILASSKDILPDHACCILMVKNSILRHYPDGIKEWLENLQRAGEYIHSDPQHAGVLQEKFMKLFPAEVTQTVDSGMIDYSSLHPGGQAIAEMQDLALAYGLLPQRVDLQGFVDGSFA